MNQVFAEPFWHFDEEGTLSAVWYRSASVKTRYDIGVLVLHGIGPDETVVSQGVSEVSSVAANLGFLTLSFDFAGNGQSPEPLDQPAIHLRWQRQISAAIRFLQENGATWVAVVAPRLAGGLAVLAAQETPIDALILWSPVLSGKRYIRELKMLQATATEQSAVGEGELAVGDYIFTQRMADCVAKIDATKMVTSPAPLILYIECPNRAISDQFVDQLRALEVDVEIQSSQDTSSWLFVESHQAKVPRDSARNLINWIESQTSKNVELEQKHPNLSSTRTSHELIHNGRNIRETFVSAGPIRLSGVYTEPCESSERKIAVLFLSMGPGRSFVAASRHLATLGYCSFRFDFSGLGLSPLRPEQKRPHLYDSTGREDFRVAAEYLQSKGVTSIVVVGFCAGAWSSVSSHPLPGVVGIAAINVYLSVRDRGLTLTTAVNQMGLIGRCARFLFRLRRRLNSTKLFAGVAIRWLKDHQSAGTKIGLFFDSNDFSFKYWNNVLADYFPKQLSQKTLQVRTYEGLGHLASGRAARADMMKDIEAFISSCE